jgi:hypothetical protein
MITAKQILQNRNAEDPTTASIILEVPWDETGYGGAYRILAEAMEKETWDGIDLIDYEPVSYDSEKKTFQIKYLLGVAELLDLVEEEDVEEEGSQDETLNAK